MILNCAINCQIVDDEAWFTGPDGCEVVLTKDEVNAEYKKRHPMTVTRLLAWAKKEMEGKHGK